MERGVGRPPKYHQTVIIGFSAPVELKEFLKKVSIETGKSMSEIIVEALMEYFKIKGVKKVERKERKTAKKIFGRMEIRRLKREIATHEKRVALIQRAIADPGTVLKYQGQVVSPLQLIWRELNSLWGLEKKIIALENRGLNVVKYAEKVVELIQKLDELKEKTPY